MLYDDETGRRAHLSLPLETLDELAARMTDQPTPAVANAIVVAAQQRYAGRPNARVSASRVRADLRHASIEATVEQVAWVLTTMTNLPEETTTMMTVAIEPATRSVGHTAATPSPQFRLARAFGGTGGGKSLDQFCRTGIHSAVPAVTLTFDGGLRRLHWCAEHQGDAEPYRQSESCDQRDEAPQQ